MRQSPVKQSVYDALATRKTAAYITCQGKLTTVRVLSHGSPPIPSEKRSTVKDLSKASRTRLLRKIATIDWTAVGKSTMLTVTYPDDVAERAPARITIDRSRLIRDIETHLGKQVAILWRVEWVPRKSGKREGEITQHMHLIPFGVRYFPHAVLLKRWQQIVGYDKFINVIFL